DHESAPALPGGSSPRLFRGSVRSHVPFGRPDRGPAKAASEGSRRALSGACRSPGPRHCCKAEGELWLPRRAYTRFRTRSGCLHRELPLHSAGHFIRPPSHLRRAASAVGSVDAGFIRLSVGCEPTDELLGAIVQALDGYEPLTE